MNIQMTSNQQNFGGVLSASTLGEKFASPIIKDTSKFQDDVAKQLASSNQLNALKAFFEKILGEKLNINLEKAQFSNSNNAIIMMDRENNKGTLIKLDLGA